MTTNAAAERFMKLQTNAQEADAKVMELRNELNRRYQHHWYAPAGQRKQLERLEAAASRHSDKFHAYLTSLSPRSWDSGVPASWVRDCLTYADAVTTGALSVVPPPAWGYDVRQMEEFARPVTVAKAAGF